MGRRAIVLLVALVLAGLAAWAIWNFLQNVEKEAQRDQEIVTVFRAGPSGIAEGQEGSIVLSGFDSDVRCQDADLALDAAGNCPIKQDVDQLGDVPTDVLDSAEKLRTVLTGKVAAGPISAGSIITASQWVALSVDIKPLAEQIPSGKQALTVSTSNVQGVNGFIEAGDRINMIITLDIAFDQLPVESDGVTLPDEGAPAEGEDPGATVVTYTRFVLQGIPVMAVGSDVRVEDTDDQTGQIPAAPPVEGEGAAAEAAANATIFTLEVTPEQAERIVYAFENGSMWLTLVPPDFVEVETNGVVIDNLFGGDLVDQIFGS